MKEVQQTIYKDFPELARVDVPAKDGMRPIKSFMLRSGYLHTSDIEAIKEYYPHYGIQYEDKILDYKNVFQNDHPVIMEIGFGMGDTTARIAKERNEYNYLACEVFITGFAKLVGMAGRDKIENLRLMRFDAVTILNHMIADNSLEGFHIFFPDPWQKRKQNKRRLIQPEFADLLTKKLKEGGYIYCVTDWEEYAEQMLDVFTKTEGLANPYDGYAEQRPWRPTTHFEQKGMKAERPIREVWFEKKGKSFT